MFQGEDKGFQVCRKKMATSAEALCKYNAPEFCKFTEAVVEMKFDEEPKYAALVALFEPILVGCVHKPICVDIAIKVSMLRMQELTYSSSVKSHLMFKHHVKLESQALPGCKHY